MTRSLIFAILLISATAVRSGPTEDLLRIVPKECSVCFVVQDLRRHSEQMAASPFVGSLAKNTWGQSLVKRDDWNNLQTIIKTVSEQLGTSIDDVRDDILGDAIVLAYQPGQKDEAKSEAGLVLIHARRPEKLVKLLDSVNAIQKSVGDLTEVDTRKVAGRTITTRRKKNDQSDVYLIDGNIFAYSAQPKLLQSAIAAMEASDKTKACFLQARQVLGFEQSAFCCLVDPRAIERDLPKTSPKDDAAFQQIRKTWQSIDAVGLAIQLGSGVDFTLAVKTQGELPKPYDWLMKQGQSNTLWSAIPEKAPLAIAAHTRLHELREFINLHLEPEDKEKFNRWINQQLGPIVGKDMLPKVIDQLGPVWGLWLNPISGAKVEQFPTLMLAIQLPEANEVRSAVTALCEFVMHSVRVAHNTKNDTQLTYRTEANTRWLENDKVFPLGFQPSFGVMSQYLLVSSSPEAIQQFKQPTQPVNADRAGLMARIYCPELARCLRQPAFVKSFAKMSHKEPEEVASEFKALADFLDLFERWELRHVVTGPRFELTWKIQTAQPLKK